MHGVGASAGQVAGPLARLPERLRLPAGSAQVDDPDAEIERALAALEQVACDLERRAGEVAGAAADVLAADALIARDPALAGMIRQQVRDGADAPHGVAGAFAQQRELLTSLGGYMAERATDLDDLRDRAVARLLGAAMPGMPEPGHPFVLVAGDLAPADTATLDPQAVLAIVTERGGPTGHTAIIAKQLGIPAIVACAEARELQDGDLVLVDGSSGELIVDPSEVQVAAARELQRELAHRRALGNRGRGETRDGHAVPLLANIGGPGDLSDATLRSCEGVGLFRTEFLYLDSTVAPSYEQQVAAYDEVFAAFDSRRVVVRTLDVGADKPLPYLGLAPEPNPALGVRGLRLARVQRELLGEQLRAIAEAAGHHDADVWVMAPMVATAREAREFVTLAHEHGLAHAGVMVEIPAAALAAHAICDRVEFVSIGTNDLTQYTMAADRLAGDLSDLLDPWQPAVLRLEAMTASAGQEAGCSIGVCGEAASDPLLALVLVGLGATSLSMAPACIAEVRAGLAEQTYAQCQRLAALALAAADADAARAAVAEQAAADGHASLV